MAIPRRDIVDHETPGFYHCISRCVRRAYLCGDDPYTGKNCDHRKAWLEKRMLELASIFSVELYAYAVMDNHYHLVVYIDPKAPEKWTDEQVAEKWLLAYPGDLDKPENAEKREIKKIGIMNDPKKLKKYRKRFGQLSWFMSRLNEPLAKSSNFEDCVKGRFWESRYTSIALLDETAILSCMAYVDLNPIRAGMVEELQHSLYTSIKKRIDTLKIISATHLHQSIEPMASGVNGRALNIKLSDYIELVEWTGKSIIHPNKASMPAHIASIINQLNLQPDNWLSQITQLGQSNSIAIGSVKKLKEKAEALKRSWIKGVESAKLLYVS